MKTNLILASLAMVVLMVAAVGAGTLAYFSDTETSGNNTFTAGTIELAMGELTGEGQVITIVEGAVVEDLKPCQTGYMIFWLYNEGTNPMEVWKHIFGVENDENGVTEPEQAEYNVCCGCEDNLISDYIHYDMYVCRDLEEEEIPEYPYDQDEIDEILAEYCKLKIDENEGFTLTGDRGVECCWMYLGTLDVEECMLVIQSYHLDGDVSNWAQSDRVTFDIEFFGQQTTPPGPAPTPQLNGHGRF